MLCRDRSTPPDVLSMPLGKERRPPVIASGHDTNLLEDQDEQARNRTGEPWFAELHGKRLECIGVP